MIDSKYAVDCLRQGFERYIRYKKIDATIDIGSNYVSFYVNDFDNTGKQYMARTSTHHLKMQRIADKDKPWKGDNISIAFITPKSKQDSQVRATVRQNAQGTIQPFDITTYQYNNTILDESDLSDIFHSIVSFLNGQGYSDPFKGTAKQAKVISRHSNIKPYKVPATHTNISIDSNNNNRITTKNGYGADYVSESKDIYNNNDIKTENYMRNNKRTIRLTESDLHRVIKESVRQCLTELDWRTYASYADKRWKQAQDDQWNHRFDDSYYESPYLSKYREGQKAKRKAFNDQYFDGEDVEGYMGEKGINMQEPFGGDRNYVNSTWRDVNGVRKKSLSDDEAKSVISNDENYGKYADSFINAAHDKADYYSGKSKYVKGKGWQ